MRYTIRQARVDDVESISGWTTDTFWWGDYVPKRLPGWLEDPASYVAVCVDDHDAPVGVAHTLMMSSTEAWIEAARVHPDHRRSGVGAAMNHAGVSWAKHRGGRVMRLATEAENEAAISQVKKLGYRGVSSWLFSELEVRPRHRCDPRYRLRPGPRTDAEAAWLSWSAGDLSLGGRELIALGWQWRTAIPSDVMSAVGRGEFFQSPAGWVVLQRTSDDSLQALWIATGADEILVLLDGVMDHAAENGVGSVTMKLPNLGWTAEAIRRFGGSPRETLIFSLAIV